MRNLIAPITACALVAACAPFASAATTFNGGAVRDALNWTNGLPDTVGNPGTIGEDGSYGTNSGQLDGLFITQTAGSITRNGNGQTMAGGSYTLEGGTMTGRGPNLSGGAVFTVDGGDHVVESGRDMNVAGSVLNILSGTSSIGRDLEISNGSTFTISGGSLSVGGDIGTRNFHSAANYNFNGGTTTAKYFSFGVASTYTFGGSTAGSVTIENFGGSRHDIDDIRIDFLSGSLMTMTLTNPVESGDWLNFQNNPDGDIGWSNQGSESGLEWAEELWATGRLTHDGQGVGDLGAWGTVEGTLFAYDDGSNTLSLVPEPSSLALLGLGGLCVLRRRRA